MSHIPIPVTRDDFRLALEYGLEEREGNLRQRFRIKRALRNQRVFERLFQQLSPRMASDLAFKASVTDLFDWIVENWDEIARIILFLMDIFG